MTLLHKGLKKKKEIRKNNVWLHLIVVLSEPEILYRLKWNAVFFKFYRRYTGCP